MEKNLLCYAKREIQSLKKLTKDDKNLDQFGQILDTALLELEAVIANRKVCENFKQRYNVKLQVENEMAKAIWKNYLSAMLDDNKLGFGSDHLQMVVTMK